MRIRRSAAILLIALLTSCASTPEEVREREAEKTRHYAEATEKRKIRTEAREDRIDIWYDGIFDDADDDF